MLLIFQVTYRMAKELAKHGFDCFVALQLGLESAAQNNTKKVLGQISFLLGDLLNAAISEGDILTAAYFMKAGASVNFGINYFLQPQDAFFHHAALAYFEQAKYDEPCPTKKDVMQAYLETCYSCKQCDKSLPDLELFDSHIGRFVEYPLLVAVQQRNEDAIKFLIQNGAKSLVDCGYFQGKSHTTPFSYAVSSEFINGVEVFLHCGIDINKDIHAAVIENCSEIIFKLFLRAGLHHKRITNKSQLAIAAGKDGSNIPLELQESLPASLKFICRQVIRQTLLESRSENLFINSTQQKLCLPGNLCAYLVCDCDIGYR